MTKRSFLVLLIAALVTVSAVAQSIPMAKLSGKIVADGASLPGVTVTVTSPSMQGQRSVVTNNAGDYLLPFLPPGAYTVVFDLAGMQKVTKKVTLAADIPERIDIEMRPASLTESITVTAETPMLAAVESTQVSTNFKQDLVQQLPIQRNITAIATLAPGVNSNGPSGGNTMISGAMSYDNLYLVNGAIVNENLRGMPRPVFIEDAVQETTVLTGGISAEYGHFTGGVVSAITKSGGNDLSGSFRENLTNDSWTAKTPLTQEQTDKINGVHEATLGGPFLRDRLWFFVAGRKAKTSDTRQTVPGFARAGDQDANGNAIAVGTPLTPISYPHKSEERRVEGKLTGSLGSKQTFIASYLDVAATENNQTGQTIMDTDSLVPARETPDSMLAVNYNGVVTSQLFFEAQYSNKKYAFLHSGSSFYDIEKGTLVIDRARANARYWSPTFRNTADGEHRNNRSYTARASYFLSSPKAGSHELKAGYENFWEMRKVNNYQNGSDYRLSVRSTMFRGNTIYPQIFGGATGTSTYIYWYPIFVPSLGSEYTTKSFYLNDRWNLNDHWSFNIGARYDKNHALSGDHKKVLSNDSSISPRLAAHYDLFKDGRFIINASYGSYIGRLSEGAANDGDPAGRQSSFSWYYRGPDINTNTGAATSALVPTGQAIKQVMDWFFANGGTTRQLRTTPSVPGVDSIIDPAGLASPYVDEWSIGGGTAIGTKGYARLDYVNRKWHNFYTSLSTGQQVSAYGYNFDQFYVSSNDDYYNRTYHGIHSQFNYRFNNRWSTGGTYTWARLIGNVTGEDTGSGPLVGSAGEYPEYRQASWNYPTGYLTGDQRHRARVWGAYTLPTAVGDFNFTVMEAFDSGIATSLDASIDSRPYVTNPGYKTPPSSVTYYFGGRGTIKSDNIYRTDLAINYRLKKWGGVEFYAQPQIINVFNQQGIESFNEVIYTAYDDKVNFKAFNPFTDKPIECPQGAALSECAAMGANYQKDLGFGKPDSEGDYQTPRTYRVSFGVRF